METLNFTAVVVGGGTGGYPCAIRLGQLGVKTLIIEENLWGGVCLNVGCIPSKALITAGKRYEELLHLGEMGITVPEGRSIDMARLQSWKQGVVDKLTGGVRTLLKANKAERLEGHATFVDARTVEVETRDGRRVRVQCEHLVVATGSRPIEIPGFSFQDPRVLDSTGALALDHVPARAVVIGGGYIGLELGQMLNKLGSAVTVVEMMDQVLPGFDPDVVAVIARKLKKAGIQVHLQARALGWEEAEDGARVHIETKEGRTSLPADRILVTVGRRPNSEQLAPLGLALDRRGHVIVDRQQKTSVPGVYAVGDVATGTMLAHKASHEGEIAAEVIAGHPAFNDARTVPAVVFTDPEIATAGLQEPEARAAGRALKVGKVPFAAIGRALTAGDTDGFCKVILDASDQRVLGITIVGPHASDLISEGVLAVEMDAEGLDLALSIHPHPTLSEVIMEASKAALGQAIHVVNR